MNLLQFDWIVIYFFFQAEDGIRDLVRSRGLGDVYKRQGQCAVPQVRHRDGFRSAGRRGSGVSYQEPARVIPHLQPELDTNHPGSSWSEPR